MSTVVTEVQAVETKVLAIKGDGTEMPVLAIKLSGEKGSVDIARRLVHNGGYHGVTVILMLLEPANRKGQIACTYDSYVWGNGLTSIGWTTDDEIRTAHAYIEARFDDLKIGDVLHVDGPGRKVTKVTTYGSNGNSQ